MFKLPLYEPQLLLCRLVNTWVIRKSSTEIYFSTSRTVLFLSKEGTLLGVPFFLPPHSAAFRNAVLKEYKLAHCSELIKLVLILNGSSVVSSFLQSCPKVGLNRQDVKQRDFNLLCWRWRLYRLYITQLEDKPLWKASDYPYIDSIKSTQQ